MPEKATTGSRRYWVLLLTLAFLVCIGLVSYTYQLSEGLGITGLSRDVSWGFYIAQFTFLVGVAASAIFFDEARNSRITKDEVYKIILGLKDDSPFLKFADNEMSRVAIAKTCEGLYDYFLSEMISESNPVTALYKSLKPFQEEKFSKSVASVRELVDKLYELNFFKK